MQQHPDPWKAADYAEFPIKRIERDLCGRVTRFFLGRPSGQVFPLRVGQSLTFDTWNSRDDVCLGGAVGEGWIEIRDEDFVRAYHTEGSRRRSLPTILIRPAQIVIGEGLWPNSSVFPVHRAMDRRVSNDQREA